MHKDYTILIPDMCPIHFALFKGIFKEYGYKVEVLKNEGPQVVNEGLKYVHNDTCYPALLVIGQMIDALKSGKYDLDKVALMMSQTGGGCRASNYIFLIKKALKKIGLDHIPVIAFDLGSLGRGGGFRLSLPMMKKFLVAVSYGDALMLLNNQVIPYEVNRGDSQAMLDKWIAFLQEDFQKGKSYSMVEIRKNLKKMVTDFYNISRLNETKIKVGIVGEIYVKYSRLANNHLEEFLVGEDCEVMVPGLMGFVLYSVNNGIEDVDIYGGSKLRKSVTSAILHYINIYEEMIINAVKKYSDFNPPTAFLHLKTLTEGIIDRGVKMGEGWVLTAEMVDLVINGYENIISAQPFGCLPNHIVAKGMMRKVKEVYPSANIVAIDYDPGATKVNQENRIKLMLAVAKENQDLNNTSNKNISLDKEVSIKKSYKLKKNLYSEN